MRKSSLPRLLLIALLAILSLGVFRLQLDTDILSVLPQNVPAVSGLKEFRTRFVDEGKLILLIESPDDTLASNESLATLADSLQTAIPDTTLEFKDAWEENPEQFAILLSYLWLNADPETFTSFAEPLLDGTSETVISDAREFIASSLDQAAVVRTTYDPLGFLWHPAVQSLMDANNISMSSGNKRLTFVSTTRPLLSYREQAAWLTEIQTTTQNWIETHPAGKNHRIAITGDPAFGAEIGSGMEKDMRGTIILTSLVIGLLFLVIIRSFGQLLGAKFLLLLTLLSVVGFWGWFAADLTIVSVGFASILIGLVIDYTAVLAREAACHPDWSANDLRRKVGPSILWAALTTALVFATLSLSTLPGVAQLGSLVAIGLAIGAALVLWLFPLIAVRSRPQKNPLNNLPSPALSPKLAAITSITLLALVLITTSRVGVQKIDSNFDSMRPKQSEAYDTFDEIQRDFAGWGAASAEVLIHASNADEATSLTNNLHDQLASSTESYALHATPSFWPNPTHIESNRPTAIALAEQSEPLLATITEGGFNQQALPLARAILEGFAELAQLPPSEIPNRLSSSLPFTQTVSLTSPTQGVLRASIDLPRAPDEAIATELSALNSPQITLTGWGLLSETLRPLVSNDARRIPIPAAIILLIGLALVFRNLRDIALASGLLILVLLCLNLAIAFGFAGGKWNFLNIFAVPLSVGIGIDYSIHLISTLRRSHGNLASTWDGVGKAIVFCGLSTTVGFGALSMASSKALASLGALCALGAILTMTFSLLLLPGFWQWAHRRDRNFSGS